MVAFIRKVYEKGKITIPKELRELHEIEEGDYVKFQIVGVVKREKHKHPSIENSIQHEIRHEHHKKYGGI